MKKLILFLALISVFSNNAQNVKIRSTETLAVSAKYGLCDVTRQMISYSEDIRTGYIKVVVQDELIQEQIVDDTITERKIVFKSGPIPYLFSSSEIDTYYSVIGSDILTSGSYTAQSNVNKEAILIGQTISASPTGWYGMTIWIKDDSDHEIVTEFSDEI